MFLCVSPNPAIDKRLTLPALVPGGIHRTRTVESFPGGKSTHVAMALKELGAEPDWVGMCGGAAGEELLTGLRSLGITAHASAIAGRTRTNLEILEDSGGVTEIREAGEEVSAEEVAAFERDCRRFFEQGGSDATVLLSGSLPPGAPVQLYARLIAAARECGCKTLLDTGGEPLRKALAAKLDFVKPNRDEASELLETRIDSRAAAAAAARELIARGARRAAVSLGAEGMVYCAGENEPALFAPAIVRKARSTVGCGDAALAGFAFGFNAGKSNEEVMRIAVACAAANCLAESPGAIRMGDVIKFQAQVRVEAAVSP